MKKIYFFTTIIIQIAVLCGCQKQMITTRENNTLSSNYSKYLKVENDKIVFKDYNSFQELMSILNSDKKTKLDNWVKYIGFDNSMLLAERDSNYIPPTTIEDPIMKAIVNKNGVFVIGEKIYKIMKDTVYTILDGNYETLTKIENGNLSNIDNVSKFYTENRIANSKIFSGQSEFYMYLLNGSFIKSSSSNIYDGNKYVNDRVRISAWSRNFGLYSSNGIQEEYQNKTKNIWGNVTWKAGNQIDHGIINGTTEGRYASLLEPWLPFYVSGSDEEYLVTRVDKTLFYQAIQGTTIETNYINGAYQFNIYKVENGITKYYFGSIVYSWQ